MKPTYLFYSRKVMKNLFVSACFLFLNEAIHANEYVQLRNFSCVKKPYGLILPINYQKLLQISILQNQTIDSVEDNGDNIVTRKTLVFPGLKLGVVLSSNNPTSYLLSFAQIKDRAWKKLSQFYVGQSVNEVLKILGGSSGRDGNLKSIYGSITSSVEFKVANDEISEINYDCYSD